MISSVFVDRPRLAVVIAIIITLAGGLALTRIPVAQFPRHRAAAGPGLDRVPRRLRQRGGIDGRPDAGGGDRRRRSHDLHEVEQRQRRQLRPHGQLRHRHRSRHRHRQRQQPGADGAVQAAGRGPALRPDGEEAVVVDPVVPPVLRRGRQARSAVHQQLRHPQRAGPAVAHARRRPGAIVRQARLLDADLVRHRPAEQLVLGAVRHRAGDPAAERAGPRRAAWRAADGRRQPVPAQRPDPGPADLARAVRQDRRARQSGRLGAARRRRRPRRARRRQQRRREPAQRQSRGIDRHLSRPRGQRRRDLGQVARHLG